MTDRYSIRELVEATGIPRRTIRYYVQRGLIPAPEGAGRGHFYTEEHRVGLQRVRALQARGYSLDEIAAASNRQERDSDVETFSSLEAPMRLESTALELRESPAGDPTSAQPDAQADARPNTHPNSRPDALRTRSLGDPSTLTPGLEHLTRIHLAAGVELSFAPPARVPSPARLRAIALAVARLLEH